MTINKLNLLKTISRFLILMVILSLGLSVLSGCGSSKASEKADAKKKKEKAAKAGEEEAEEETPAEESKKDENADANSNKPKPHEDKAGKGDAKHGEKTAAHGNGEEVWTDLLKGNKRFIGGKHTVPQLISMRKQLSTGQKPRAIILGCSDSRVPPELLFDKNLGELFVIRNAGNIADPIVMGSIEYAVEHLHAELLVVLGHESCGAVKAAVSGEEMPTKNLQAIVEQITPSFESSKTCLIGGEINMSCVELNVDHTAEELMEKSSVIKEAVKAKHLMIVKAVYKLESGEVTKVE